MKKFISLFLATILCLSMAACSDSDSFDDEDEDEDEEQSEKEENTEDGELKKVSIEKQVIYDQNGIKVTVTGLSINEFIGATLELELINNTDSTITIGSDDCSVNNLMVTALLYSDVEPGATVQDEMTFTKNILAESDITVLQTIEFKLTFADPETYDKLFEDHPVSLTTSADPSYKQPIHREGTVILDDQNVRVTVMGVIYDDIMKRNEIKLFIENKSAQEWTVQAKSLLLNGLDIYHYFSCSLPVGKMAYDTISFDADALTANSITEFMTMDIALRVIDFENYQNTYTAESVSVELKSN